MKSVIFLVDMQSFYASIEKAEHPELKHKPVIVSGDPERRSGVVLAACPIAKTYGVQNASRLWEAQQRCPHAEVIRPRMQHYIDVSFQITEILEQFTDLVEVFSVDEQFMNLTPCRKLWGEPRTAARKIQSKVWQETGIFARIGIAPNKVLAKMACDHFAKKNADGLFQLDADNMKEQLWPLPAGALFGVGGRMEQHLRRMGIRTIGHLAQFPLHLLKKRWGINGHRLWLTANGIDPSPVTPKTYEQQKAVGHHMTLPRDYEQKEEIKVVLLELSQEVARRARFKHYVGQTVSVGIRGADFDNPSGFHRQKKRSEPTHFDMDIFETAYALFCEHWDERPVRSVGVTLSSLQSSRDHQLSLFDEFLKKEHLSQAMDHICTKYGPDSLVRAASLTKAGQTFERAKKLGGHYK